MNRVRSLLSIHCAVCCWDTVLKPRPNIAVCLVQRVQFNNPMIELGKPVWQVKTRLTCQEVRDLATSNAWRGSGRASLSPPHSRRQKLKRGRLQGSNVTVKLLKYELTCLDLQFQEILWWEDKNTDRDPTNHISVSVQQSSTVFCMSFTLVHLLFLIKNTWLIKRSGSRNTTLMLAVSQ